MPALDLAVLLGWAQGPVSPVAIGAALLAAGYVLLFRRARRRDRALAPGRRGPGVGQAAVFVLGCVLIVLVTATGVQTYSLELFSAFMFQQLTLLMIVPPLLILGRPGTVLLRGLPRHGVGLVALRAAVGSLRSSFARAVVNPIAVFPLLLVPLFGLYLTGAIDALLATEVGRAALQIGFVADIGLHGKGGTAGIGNLFDYGISAVFVVGVVDYHGGALRGQGQFTTEPPGTQREPMTRSASASASSSRGSCSGWCEPSASISTRTS